MTKCSFVTLCLRLLRSC
uniref:Uncharacterized protein n=1 Tax=Rhizophora mucronata TaxID=61149 RepID=A0A2P2NBV1_RHIMU